MYNQLIKEFRALKDDGYHKQLTYFFKTGPGQYGEGDQFLGLRMSDIRKVASKYRELELLQVQKLIDSKWHEERMLGLIILVNQYQIEKKDNPKQATKLYKYYLKNFKQINNWDLVDVTAPKIVGAELFEKDRDVLYKWVKSNHLWTRRISIVSTWHFIKNKDYKDAIKLSKLLLNDKEDLMHKASGWMLREVGKKDRETLDKFLKTNYKKMPRTMLRYSIEKHPESVRKKILKGTW
ncbi:DNA alkylation repair protein [bacterium]|nr:DNA alkylation repair protein [bacterium]